MILDDEERATLDALVERQRRVVNELRFWDHALPGSLTDAAAVLQQLLVWQQTAEAPRP